MTASQETIDQIYELRSLLESAAAQAAATQASDGDRQRLRETLDAIEAAYRANNFPAVLRATNQFYEAMFMAARKPVAWEMVQRLNGRISWLRSLTVSSAGRNTAGPRQLRKIMQAIASGDGEAAAAACRSHLETASGIARRLLAAGRQAQ